MCASVAVADLFAYYYFSHFGTLCEIDCCQIHERVCGELQLPPSKRLDGALDLWEKGLIDAKVTDGFTVSSSLRLINRETINSTSASFAQDLQKEIDANNPIILDVPLMVSAFCATTTGIFPLPYSIENDKRVSRHIMLIVGYCSFIGEDNGGWIIRNCWGRKWGKDGLGLIPFRMTDTGEMLKATILKVITTQSLNTPERDC